MVESFTIVEKLVGRGRPAFIVAEGGSNHHHKLEQAKELIEAAVEVGSGQLPVGLSDHALGITVPMAAVARGACSIEKTLTLSNSLLGPDHGYALEPGEFKKLVEAVRTTEESLGSPNKTMFSEEAEVALRLECLPAARDIQLGEVITDGSLTMARPAAGGIRPRFINAVIGSKARVPIKAGEPILWDKI